MGTREGWFDAMEEYNNPSRVSVPKEPTEAMMDAAFKAYLENDMRAPFLLYPVPDAEAIKRMYRAMIKAAT